MTPTQTIRLIEWLKSNGFDDGKIVECLEFINGLAIFYPRTAKKSIA